MRKLLAVGLVLIMTSALLVAGCKPKEGAGPDTGGDTSGMKGAEMMKQQMKAMGKTKRPGD